MKTACGTCGSSGCGCNKPENPYLRGVDVVWHNPTKYDFVKHGPDFLPKIARSELATVKAFVKKAAWYATVPSGSSRLSLLLQAMRGSAVIHQSHHWQTNGPSFFADHQLFDDLYKESLPLIDQVAERAVGTDGPAVVGAVSQTAGVHGYVDAVYEGVGDLTATEMVMRSLRAEIGLLAYLDLALSEQVSPGTRALLEEVADVHEKFVYLLKQRGGSTYNYDRG